MFDWISPEQKGATPGRIGLGNVRKLADKFHEDAASRKEGYLLFIDFEAAFPSVQHSWIMHMLEKVGFPPQLSRCTFHTSLRCGARSQVAQRAPPVG